MIKINTLVIGLEIFFFSIRELFTDSNQHPCMYFGCLGASADVAARIMPLAKCQQEPTTCPSREYRGAQLNTQHLTFTYSLQHTRCLKEDKRKLANNLPATNFLITFCRIAINKYTEIKSIDVNLLHYCFSQTVITTDH